MKLPDFLDFDLNPFDATLDGAALRSLCELVVRVGQAGRFVISPRAMSVAFDEGYTAVAAPLNEISEGMHFTFNPTEAAIALQAMGTRDRVEAAWHGARRSNLAFFEPGAVSGELFDCELRLDSEMKLIDAQALLETAKILDDSWYEEDTKGPQPAAGKSGGTGKKAKKPKKRK